MSIPVLEEIDSDLFNISISEIHLSEAVSLDQEAPLGEVLEVVQEKRVESVALEKQGRITGILTGRDFLMKVIVRGDDWSKIPASQIMTPSPLTVSLDAKVRDCIKLVSLKEIIHLPVCDSQGKMQYMMNVNDLLRFVTKQFPRDVSRHGTVVEWSFVHVDDFEENLFLQIKDKNKLNSSVFMASLKRVIFREPLRIDYRASLWQVLRSMQEERQGSVLLMEYETKLKGILTERDFLMRILGKMNFRDSALLVEEVMTPDPHTLLFKHNLAHAINNMAAFRYRNIIIVNEDKFPLAVVGPLDIFKFTANSLNIV